MIVPDVVHPLGNAANGLGVGPDPHPHKRNIDTNNRKGFIQF
jgi:hypothetical protein